MHLRIEPLSKLALAAVASALVAATPAVAGPYSDSTGRDRHAIDGGIPGLVSGGRVNPRLRAFATSVFRYEPTDLDNLDPRFTDPTRALGPVTGDSLDIVSLGDLTDEQIAQGVPPGSIVLEFDRGIRDRRGADFVVFENGFEFEDGVFGEFAYVEVSSDGETFARFLPFSLTSDPIGAFEVFDATDVFNLAGKHANNDGVSWGTPFDLSLLEGNPAVEDGSVNLRKIKYVRIVDIPGSGAFTDALGQPIFDPFPTAFPPVTSGGFDLEAIGVIHPARR